MAKQIENRVVEMEFKNKDFEKAIAVTMDSLDQLNKKLDDLNKINTSGFEEITKAANKIDFSGALTSIDTLAERFTTITGKIKSQLQDWVIEDIIKKPMQELEKVADSVMNTIVEKGKTRSKNLSQAKFQLEALGVAWEQVYKDMDYAVTGTAYGMDEAAMAASQFAASNVQLGDSAGGMARSLRAISGVAAMTGRGYSEIAQIFTTVAGTGRAMNGELNRIAERGLNAKKAIADYLNTLDNSSRVTQNDVEEMARKGQISFKIFSEAMMTAFGEHAAKANDLFEGAFANTKAALGRIGERFATPIYEDLRQVLVNLIPIINDFKKSLDPVVNSVSRVTGAVRELAVEILQDVHGSFDAENHFLLDWFGTEIDVHEQLIKLLNEVGDAIDGISMSLEGGLASEVGEMFLNILYNVIELVKSIKKGLSDVFTGSLRSNIYNIFDTIKKLTEQLILNESQLDKISRIARGIGAFIDIIGKTVKAVWKAIIKPIFEDFGFVFDDILDLFAQIGDVIYGIDQNYDPFVPMRNTILSILPTLLKIKNRIVNIYESVTGFLSKLTGIHDVQSFFEKMDEVASHLHIADIFYGIAGAIIYAFDHLTAFIELMSGNTTFKEYLQSIKESSIILSWFSDKIEKIKKTWNDLWSGNITLSQALGIDKLLEKFSWLQVIIDKFKEHYGSIFTADYGDDSDLATGIQKWGSAFKKALLELDFQEIFSMIATAFYTYFAAVLMKHRTQLVDSIKGVVDDLKGVTGKISEALNGMTKGVQENKLLSIGKGLALIVGSIFMLALIPEQDLNKSMDAVMTLLITLGAIFAIIGLIFMKYGRMQQQASDAGVLLLEDHGGGKGGLGGFFSKLGDGVGNLTDGIKTALSDLSKAPAMLIAFGAAIFLLASSIYKLKDVDPANLLAATIAIEVLMVSMGVIMTKMRTPDTTKLAGVFLAMGIAISIMMKSILLMALLPEDKIADAAIAWFFVEMLLITMTGCLDVLAGIAINPASVLAAAGAMMMMAAAIGMMMIPILSLTLMFTYADPWDVISALGSTLYIMMTLLLVVELLNMTELNPAGAIAGAGAMMMVAEALTMMMIPISVLTNLFSNSYEFEVIGALSAIIIIMGMMALVVAAMGSIAALNPAAMGGMLAGAAAMVLVAIALTALLIPLGALTAMAKSGDFEVAFVTLCYCLGLLAAAAAVAALLAPGLTALVTVVVGVAGAIFLLGAAVEAAGKGVFYFVSALAMLAVFDFGTVAENITKQGSVIKQAILTLIGGALEAFIECTDMAVEAAVIMALDVIKGLDAHSSELGYHLGHAIMNIIGSALAGVLASFGDGFIGLLGAIFGFDVSDAKFSDFLSEKLFGKDGGKEAADKASGGFFNNLKDSISGVFSGDELTQTVDGNSIGVKAGEGAAEGFEESFFGGIKGMSAGAGADYADEFYAEFDKGMNDPASMSNIQDTMSKFTAGAGSALEGDTTISDAMKKNYGGALTEGTNVLDIKNGMSMESFKQWEMVDLGGAEGLMKNGYLEKAMKEKDTKVLSIHQADWKQHSPSRVMMESGKYIDEGLAIGLTKSTASEEAIDKKSSGLIAMFTSIGKTLDGSVKTSGLNSLSEAISSIANSAAMETDLTPTITPVLDLSNVNQGFSSLDSMFSAQRSVQLAGEASYLNDAGRSLTMQIQNDNRRGTNNNINALGSKIDRLGDAIMNRQIVLDSGELVGGLVNPMDRSLGTRAIMAQRA